MVHLDGPSTVSPHEHFHQLCLDDAIGRHGDAGRHGLHAAHLVARCRQSGIRFFFLVYSFSVLLEIGALIYGVIGADAATLVNDAILAVPARECTDHVDVGRTAREVLAHADVRQHRVDGDVVARIESSPSSFVTCRSIASCTGLSPLDRLVARRLVDGSTVIRIRLQEACLIYPTCSEVAVEMRKSPCSRPGNRCERRWPLASADGSSPATSGKWQSWHRCGVVCAKV